MLKVLVVDDSLDVQESLAKLLTAVDGVHVVGFAEDVPEALALVDAVRPDVVVLDVELRGGDTSMIVLRHVVEHYPQMQVIMLSNFTWGSLQAGFLAAGACAYFDKSLEFSQARDWIADLTHRDPGSPLRC